jgi:multiple RNA-binding domain-containing protein 1
MFSDRDILCFANDSQLERDFSRCFSLLNYFRLELSSFVSLRRALTYLQAHLVRDNRSNKSKGIAFAQFREPEAASNVLRSLDGAPFQGRLLHVLPASEKRNQKLSDFDLAKLPLKKQKELKRKANTASPSFSWNSLYMNPDAVLASVAARLGVTKADLLDPTSTDGAVKQARAETSIVQETREYFKSQGVNIDVFKGDARHDRALLLKNFSFGTTMEELTAMLSEHGSLERVLFPPSGTIAIALFEEAIGAKLAFQRLAYANIKGSVLYLEKAPSSLFDFNGREVTEVNKGEDDADVEVVDASGTTSTVFIRNLNFATTTARLSEVFKPLAGFVSARVKTRTDPSRPGQILSMGFGFAEFRSKQQALAGVATMNGHNLDGHQLIVQPSNKATDAAQERRENDKMIKSGQGKTKIIIKNLAFEVSKKDVKSLLGSYGKLRSVRMPKKFDNSARGFAFAEFVTHKEAKNAMEALSDTHLLGRKLVFEYAATDLDDPEETIKAMEKKAGRQSHLTAVNKLMTGSARKKFTTDVGDGQGD